MNAHGEERLEKRKQVANALEHARFEAARAHRQYDQVDPDNRLVAGELERRWNERLASVQMAGGSASALTLSRPAQASHALRPAGSLSRPRRPLSRGSDPASYPAASLASF